MIIYGREPLSNLWPGLLKSRPNWLHHSVLPNDFTFKERWVFQKSNGGPLSSPLPTPLSSPLPTGPLSSPLPTPSLHWGSEHYLFLISVFIGNNAEISAVVCYCKTRVENTLQNLWLGLKEQEREKGTTGSMWELRRALGRTPGVKYGVGFAGRKDIAT